MSEHFITMVQKKAATILHYNNIEPQVAFICECSESIHLATLSDEKSLLICTISHAELKLAVMLTGSDCNFFPHM